MAAGDIDAYVARLDGECASTGLENPILRKALGSVFLGKKRHADAARQLRRAVDAAPTDFEIYPKLISALEAMGPAWSRLEAKAIIPRRETRP